MPIPGALDLLAGHGELLDTGRRPTFAAQTQNATQATHQQVGDELAQPDAAADRHRSS